MPSTLVQKFELAVASPSKSLKLDYSSLGNKDAKQLVLLIENNKSLDTIHFNNPRDDISHENRTQELIKAIFKNPALRTLKLHGQHINAADALVIAEALKNNHPLESLDLTRNPIDNQGALAIAYALEHNKTLKSLTLSCINIDQITAEKILNILNRNQTLLEINVDFLRNRIPPMYFQDLPIIPGKSSDEVREMLTSERSGNTREMRQYIETIIARNKQTAQRLQLAWSEATLGLMAARTGSDIATSIIPLVNQILDFTSDKNNSDTEQKTSSSHNLDLFDLFIQGSNLMIHPDKTKRINLHTFWDSVYFKNESHKSKHSTSKNLNIAEYKKLASQLPHKAMRIKIDSHGFFNKKLKNAVSDDTNKIYAKTL